MAYEPLFYVSLALVIITTLGLYFRLASMKDWSSCPRFGTALALGGVPVAPSRHRQGLIPFILALLALVLKIAALSRERWDHQLFVLPGGFSSVYWGLFNIYINTYGVQQTPQSWKDTCAPMVKDQEICYQIMAGGIIIFVMLLLSTLMSGILLFHCFTVMRNASLFGVKAQSMWRTASFADAYSSATFSYYFFGFYLLQRWPANSDMVPSESFGLLVAALIFDYLLTWSLRRTIQSTPPDTGSAMPLADAARAQSYQQFNNPPPQNQQFNNPPPPQFQASYQQQPQQPVGVIPYAVPVANAYPTIK